MSRSVPRALLQHPGAFVTVLIARPWQALIALDFHSWLQAVEAGPWVSHLLLCGVGGAPGTRSQGSWGATWTSPKVGRAPFSAAIELQSRGSRDRQGSAFVLSLVVFCLFCVFRKSSICKLLSYCFPWNGNHLDYFNEF